MRRRHEDDLRLAKFFGKLFTINFALGLVTGIVQEFQFGMNWSDYSRFVGDIFGAPLAIEALLAFFLESTFLGLWIFGWGRIPEKLHAACMWIVHVGTLLSAYFILAANSFMQNPVGYRFNPDTNRAELTDFVAVLTNKVQLVTFPHVVIAAYMVGGAMVMAVVALAPATARRGRATPGCTARPTRLGAVVVLVAGLGVAITGDIQGKIMTEVQPMKMAAAEALYESSDGNAPFSPADRRVARRLEEKFAVTVPGLLSFLATGHFDGRVEGINELKAEYAQKYGTGSPLTADATYTPNIPLAYWTFRLMIGVGMLAALIARARAVDDPQGPHPPGARWLWAIMAAPLLPILGNSFGWIFTEVGRQPWLVFGLMTTSTGVSPSVSAGEVLTSMVVFTLLYGAARRRRDEALPHLPARRRRTRSRSPDPATSDDDAPLAFAY